MTALEEILADNARKSMSRFFLRIGRKAREAWRDECTGQLFGIAEYLRCEGLLAKDAAPRMSSSIGSSTCNQAESAAAAYLFRCERAIAQAARELAA